MAVGEYAGVPLQDPADTWRHGAVFLLRKPALCDAVVSLDGWTTSVVDGVKAVITCGPSTVANFSDTFSAALAAANYGLDFICAAGIAPCAIISAADESLVWWPQRRSGGVVMQATIVQTHQFGFSGTAIVKDAAGNWVRAWPLTPKVHDALRFLRMCRTSDDLFDSYRNLFLAFESLLSDIRPQKKNANGTLEGERQWFMDALGEADKLVPLANLTPPGIRNHKKWILRRMYGDERSALMHAKQGGYLLPQDDTRRADLIASLGKLWDYIRELIWIHLGVKSGGRSLCGPDWVKVADPYLSRHTLFVSDDATPLNPLAESLVAEGSTVVELRPGAPAADPADAMLRTILGSCDAAELQRLDAIRRIGAKTERADGPAVFASELTGPLRRGDSVARLDVLYGMRNVSASAAPCNFSA